MQIQNLWMDSCREKFTPNQKDGTHSDSLSNDREQDCLEVDLLIIGGGFTGCSAALHAAKMGRSVALIEAVHIGFGGSGRNVGLVNAGLWTPPADVEAILGQEEGVKLNTALGKGPDLVFSLIEEFNIQCEATRSGTLHVAHSKSGLKDLQRRFKQLSEREAPVTLFDESAIAKKTGAKGLFGGLQDKRAGTVQPYAYCRGLARAAQSLGAKIFEKCRAQSLFKENNIWRCKTDIGEIKASYLINATNAYGQPIKGMPENSFTAVHYFQAATKPLTQEMISRILPEKHGCWDTGTIMTSFRLDMSNRLILGSIGSLDGLGRQAHLSWIKRKFVSLFPDLKDVSFSQAWDGRIAMTNDHLPRAILRDETSLTIMGYNGRGISPGTVMGKAAVELLLSKSPAEAFPIPLTSQFNQSLNRTRSAYYEFGATSAHIVNERMPFNLV
ncbi:MAG: FAD-binding oxidoreductase [Alphaproteobacteria bacterium]|nr:FAD-binding oxidoreductase [Alphaproteobacteria bacterium]